MKIDNQIVYCTAGKEIKPVYGEIPTPPKRMRSSERIKTQIFETSGTLDITDEKWDEFKAFAKNFNQHNISLSKN